MLHNDPRSWQAGPVTARPLRRLLGGVLLAVVVLGGALATAGAQPPETTTPPVASTLSPRGSTVPTQPSIIPAPNSGEAPADAGERGGALQGALFFLVCGGIVLLFLLVWRDSRRKRRAQGRLAGRRADTPAGPVSR